MGHYNQNTTLAGLNRSMKMVKNELSKVSHERNQLAKEVERLHEELRHLQIAWRYSSAREIYVALPKVIPKIIDGEEWSI